MQKDLFDQFGFECDCLKDCRCVIQNEFVGGLTEQQAKQLIEHFENSFENKLSKLKDESLKIKQFIWSEIKKEIIL